MAVGQVAVECIGIRSLTGTRVRKENHKMSTDMVSEYITLCSMRVRCRRLGSGYPMIVLHGWGSSVERWADVQRLLARSGCATYAIDLPGFGGSDAPPKAWSVDDYATLVREFVDHQGLSHFALVGHSFGGRIAIKLAQIETGGIDLLILTGSAGLRHEPTLKQRAMLVGARFGKAAARLPLICVLEAPLRRLLYFIAGERDYYRARGVMRATMVRVIDEDLRPALGRISVPTLLIWGEADRATPLQDGVEMHHLITGSRLEVVPGGTHLLPYERPTVFVELVLQALAQGGYIPSN